METCSAFLEKMYYENNDFVFSVTRDTMRGCTTPVLVMPDDTEPHPYAVAEETAMLAPQRADDFLPVEAGEGSRSLGPYATCVHSEG